MMKRLGILSLLAIPAVILVFGNPTSRESSLLVSLFIALAATIACTTSRYGALSVGGVFASLMLLFHFGLAAVIALGETPTLFNPSDIDWVEGPAFLPAVRCAAIGIMCFAAGYRLILAVPRLHEPHLDSAARRSSGNGGVEVVASIAVIVGIILWSSDVASAGIAFPISYSAFLDATRTLSLPTAYMLIGAGMGILGAQGRSLAERIALVAFAIWGSVAFVIGLRGEVIFPVCAWVVAAAHRGRITFRPRAAILAAAAALSLGSVVRVSRGVGNSASLLQNANPLQGLVELGYSIRPVVAVRGAQDFGHNPFVGFGTYLAPIQRLIEGRLLGLPVPQVSLDDRVFSVYVAHTFGQIGGSPVAEAYRAAGYVGVVLILTLLGMVCALMDRSRRGPYSSGMVGAASAALFVWVRNDFTPIPLDLLVGGALIVAGVLLDRRRPSDAAAVGAPRQLRSIEGGESSA